MKIFFLSLISILALSITALAVEDQNSNQRNSTTDSEGGVGKCADIACNRLMVGSGINVPSDLIKGSDHKSLLPDPDTSESKTPNSKKTGASDVNSP